MIIMLKEKIKEKNSDFYNIEEKYRYFNDLIWNGKLDEDLQFKWFNSKNALGSVLFKTDRVAGKIEYITSIKLSNFYDLDEKVLDSILLHEMVHVEQIFFYDNTTHNHQFYERINEINKEYPQFNIKNTEDIDAYNISKDIRVKKRFFISLQVDEVPDTYYTIFFNLSSFSRRDILDGLDNIEKQLQRRSKIEKQTVTVYNGIVEDTYFERYKISRKFSSIFKNMIMIDKNIFEKRLKDNVTGSITFIKGIEQ